MTTSLKSRIELYIYYRVRAENAEALRSRVTDMQRCLSRDYGIVTALKRRPEERDGLQTWMEIYQSIPADFECVLDRAILQSGLPALIDGQRHTEHFVDVSSCA